MQTKYLVHKDTNTKYAMHVISMQAGWFRVEQTVGPKHTNTPGDYIQWSHDCVAPDASTWPNKHTHTHTQSCKEGTHKNVHTKTHSNAACTDMHKDIPADLNLPSVCVRTP